MNGITPNSPELQPEKQPISWPWCIACGEPLNLGEHAACRHALDGSMWTPCLTCHGGRRDADGRRCLDCDGIGFWEYDSMEAAVEGLTRCTDTPGTGGGR